MIHEALQPLATPIADLKPLPGNPRKGDVEAVARSYATFGQRKPIVATLDGTVIAGNHQLAAAKQLGWEEIAVVFTEDDDLTAKAFALADNKTADLGSYDDDLLTEIIAELVVDEELLAATGYSELEIKGLLGETVGLGDTDPEPEPEFAISPPENPTTIAGDVWLLGPHRIMCGDCRVPTDVEKLIGDTKINLAFTSPPYAQQRTYDEKSGFRPISPDEYVDWYSMVSANVAAHLADDGSYFINIKPAARGIDTELYVLDLVLAHARDWGWHFATEFCWERIGMPGKIGRRFKNQFEPVYQFVLNDWKFRPEAVMKPSDSVIIPLESYKGVDGWTDKQGTPKHDQFAGQRKKAKKRTSNIILGKTTSGFQGSQSRNELLVGEGMAYPGNRLPSFQSTLEAVGHAAAFPVGLPQFFVKAYTDEGDAVFDPFMGSGSTLLAAHAENRVAFGMELSPAYVDVICARFERKTGIKPINAATKREHSFLG